MYYETIYRLAKERGISIKALEEATGLGNGTIGKWKNLKPNLGNLEKVAAHLGVSVVDIIKESETVNKTEV